MSQLPFFLKKKSSGKDKLQYIYHTDMNRINTKRIYIYIYIYSTTWSALNN